MRFPRRKVNDEITRAELLDALRVLARNIEIKHEHTIRHEPIPEPQAAEVVFKREDGSESFRYPVQVGRQAWTTCRVPLEQLLPPGTVSPASNVQMEFRWYR